MASLDLSAVFDTVNIDLLIERIKILGLPMDVVDLIELWLGGRSFYVSITESTSCSWTWSVERCRGLSWAPFYKPLFDL
jgi:hypothetical protein